MVAGGSQWWHGCIIPPTSTPAMALWQPAGPHGLSLLPLLLTPPLPLPLLPTPPALPLLQYMKEKGFSEYEAVVEGDIKATHMAAVPADIDRNRVRFMQVGGGCWGGAPRWRLERPGGVGVWGLAALGD